MKNHNVEGRSGSRYLRLVRELADAAELSARTFCTLLRASCRHAEQREGLVEAAGIVPRAATAGCRSKPKRPATHQLREAKLVEAAEVERERGAIMN
jgi:hypothetical protein